MQYEKAKDKIPAGQYAVGLFFLLIVIIIICFYQVNDMDYWLHLANGRYILEHHDIPLKDIFSYTAYGHEWVNHAWLSGVVFYLVYELGGPCLQVVFRIILMMLTFYFLFTALSRLKVHPVISFTFLGIGLSVMRFHILDRPQLFSYLFSALFLFIITNHILFRSKLILLIPLQALWANMHSACLLGLIIFAFFFAGQVIQNFIRKQIKYPSSYYEKITLLFFALFLATLVNPNTYKLFLYPFNMFEIQTVSNISEWKNTFNESGFGLFWGFAVVYLFMLAASLFRIHPFYTLISLFSFFSAVKYVRNVELFGLFGSFFTACSVQMLLDVYSTKLSSFLRKANKYALSAICIIILFLLIDLNFFSPFRQHAILFKPGCGTNHQLFPEEIMRFMKKNEIEGRIYSDSNLSSYLTFHWFPGKRIFTDGRAEVFYELHKRIQNRPFGDAMDRYEVDCVMLDFRTRIQPVVMELNYRQDEWALVLYNDRTALYLRRIPRYADIIVRYEYKILYPTINIRQIEPERRTQAIDELENPLHNTEKSYYKLFQLGCLYLLENSLDKAERSLLQSIAIYDEDSLAFSTLANVYFHKGETTRALRYAKRSFKALAQNEDSYLQLAFINRRLNNYDRAIEMFREFLEFQPDNINVMDMLIGTLYEAGREEEAKMEISQKEVTVLMQSEEHLKIAREFRNTDIVRSIGAYEMVHRLSPDNDAATLEYADALLDLGLDDRASQLLTEVKEQGAVEEHPFYYFVEGRLHFQADEPSKAAASLKQYMNLTETQPNDPYRKTAGMMLDRLLSEEQRRQLNTP